MEVIPLEGDPPGPRWIIENCAGPNDLMKRAGLDESNIKQRNVWPLVHVLRDGLFIGTLHDLRLALWENKNPKDIVGSSERPPQPSWPVTGRAPQPSWPVAGRPPQPSWPVAEREIDESSLANACSSRSGALQTLHQSRLQRADPTSSPPPPMQPSLLPAFPAQITPQVTPNAQDLSPVNHQLPPGPLEFDTNVDPCYIYSFPHPLAAPPDVPYVMSVLPEPFRDSAGNWRRRSGDGFQYIAYMWLEDGTWVSPDDDDLPWYPFSPDNCVSIASVMGVHHL